MKKSIFIALFTVIICQGSFSMDNSSKAKNNDDYTVDQLLKVFSKEKHTVHVKINKFAMSLVNVFSDTKGVNEVDVYSFDECDNDVKDRFNDAIKNLKDKDYDTLVSTTEDGERTKVLVKIKNDVISEIVVLAGGSDPAFVRIKGKIKPDDVNSVVKNNR